MANPIIQIKRSAVAGKIPTGDQLPLGELALNTFDGRLFASKNVGLGTTVFAVNPWVTGIGTNTYNTYFTEGNVGIGSTLPTSKLSVVGDGRYTGVVTATTFFGQVNAGVATITTLSGTTGSFVTGSITNAQGTNLNYSGIGTIGIFQVSSGIVTATSGILTYYGDGSKLVTVSISTAAPSSPVSGSLWYNSNYGRIFIYYNDGDSSQWVDAAPFNIGIVTTMISTIGLSSQTATNPSLYFQNDTSTGLFSPGTGQQTFVSLGSSVLNINRNGIIVTGVTTATDFNSTSDANLKQNIKVIDNPLEKVMQLNGVSFDWIDTQQSSAGVIAQDVEKVLPEIIRNNSTGYKSLNYNGLIGLLIEAVKEQQKQIEELKKQINK